MTKTQDSGSHAPGETQQRTHSDHDSAHQHVQMIATTLLQLVLLPVDDDGGDLLVHEEEDGEEEGGDAGQKVDVPEFSSSRD